MFNICIWKKTTKTKSRLEQTCNLYLKLNFTYNTYSSFTSEFEDESLFWSVQGNRLKRTIRSRSLGRRWHASAIRSHGCCNQQKSTAIFLSVRSFYSDSVQLLELLQYVDAVRGARGCQTVRTNDSRSKHTWRSTM